MFLTRDFQNTEISNFAFISIHKECRSTREFRPCIIHLRFSFYCIIECELCYVMEYTHIS